MASCSAGNLKLRASRTIPPVWLACVAIGSLVAGSAVAGCGTEQSTNRPVVTLASMSIKTPLYRFDRIGRLVKVDPSTGTWKELSNHGFDGVPDIVLSPDGRWISYDGNLRGKPFHQYWLFDRRTGRDHLYFEHPSWGVTIPVFSPDSRRIALFVNYDHRWNTTKGVGLFLLEVDNLTALPLGNPSTIATPANNGYGDATWSRDGREILVMMKAWPPGSEESTREHFSYRLSEGRYQRIAGEYRQDGDLFYRANTLIPTFDPPSMIQGRMHSSEAASPDGSRFASIDRSYTLGVSRKGGKRLDIDTGGSDQCGIPTIAIHGWLDAKRLVYSLNEKTFIYDTASDQRAELFSGEVGVSDYFW